MTLMFIFLCREGRSTSSTCASDTTLFVVFSSYTPSADKPFPLQIRFGTPYLSLNSTKIGYTFSLLSLFLLEKHRPRHCINHRYPSVQRVVLQIFLCPSGGHFFLHRSVSLLLHTFDSLS